MPRGVYDRSKSKEQRAAEKTSTARIPKVGFQGKRSLSKPGSGLARRGQRDSAASQMSRGSSLVSSNDHTHLSVLQAHLTSLANAHGLVKTPHVSRQIEESITKILGRSDAILESMFPSEKQPEMVSADAVKVTTRRSAQTHGESVQQAPVVAPVQAPVPFNPPQPVQS